MFESGPATPVPKVATVYEIAHSGFGAATLLETLESQLKLKEGNFVVPSLSIFSAKYSIFAWEFILYGKIILQ